MKTFRFYIRLIATFSQKFKGVLVLGVIFGILIFIALSFITNFYKGGRTEKIGLTGRYKTENLPDFILNEIGGGLTKIEADGTPSPNVAKFWETPDKGKTWIFTLFEDIYWQDGKKLVSEDLSYQFTDVSVERPNDYTISFKLKDSYSPFPAVVSQTAFKKGLLGVGDWKAEKLRIVGEYFEELILVKGKNKKIYKFYPTEEKTKNSFILGETDILKNILNPAPFYEWSTARVDSSSNKNQIVTIFFNTESSFFSEKNARQAASYALDKTSFKEDRAISPISPSSWAYNSQVKKYDFDKNRSLELMDEIPDETKNSLPVKLVSTPALLPLAETISSSWKDVGIDNIIQVSSVTPTEYDAFLVIFDIPPDPDQYTLWHSTQAGSNISRYKNPRIDKLLEDGRLNLDTEARKKIYLDFQRFLLEDAPAAFLFHPTWYTISRK